MIRLKSAMTEPTAISRIDRRSLFRASSVGLAVALLTQLDRSEETWEGVLYPKRISPANEKFSWYEPVVARIPRLRHVRGSRWPLISWGGFSTEPQAPSYYQELLARGLAQPIRLDPGMIDTTPAGPSLRTSSATP